MHLSDAEELPVIAIGENTLEEYRENAIKHGMNAHIAKPLDIDVFMDILRQILIK